ncbi:MAG: alpha-mannosidase [Clostridiales bacterium]|nr:alpha-mannosidase [Clostridiales bacterium]
MKEKLQCAKCVLRDFVYNRLTALEMVFAKTAEPVAFSDRMKLSYAPIKEGEKWSDDVWDCGWFHVTGKIPTAPANRELYLALDFDGEGCIFDCNGVPIRGITNVSSTFDRELGLPGKKYVALSECVRSGDDEIDIWIETGNNDLFGDTHTGSVIECAIVACDSERLALFYDYAFLLDLIESVPDEDPLHYTIAYALEKVAVLASIDMNSELISQCRDILKPQLERKNIADPLLKFYAVGHSHLDLAWLWPIRETHRKAGRTFATAVANLEKYPHYIYGASQPQQFEWVKNEYPALYEKIKANVAEGRFEVQGGMWVEADTNITGGESLVRQFVYGMKFWKDEFDKEVDTLWLPDVFGFSGAIPQIMLGCGCENFVTIKLSWNMVNRFPYHSFKWRGIDGSEVLAHIPPAETYNSSASAKELRTAAGTYSERGLSKNALMLYGIGDGGGGPGEGHLENTIRAKNICGVPNVTCATSKTFFAELKKERDALPTYKGEIYLERHQGTYTSQAKNKLYNRRMETALGVYEFAQVVTDTAKAEKDITDRLWKETLLYQFHDILPGSSIKRVYDGETLPTYKQMLDQATQRTGEILSVTGNSLCAVNATSFARDEYVKADGVWYRAKAEPYSVAKLKKADGSYGVYADATTVGNELVEVTLSGSGAVLSVKDKRNGREALKNKSGELLIYDDCGNAWDFYHGYKNGNVEKFEKTEIMPFIDGPRAGVKIKYVYRKSTLVQEISVTAGSPLVRFDVTVDWQELEKMLRTDFYPNIETDEVVCDIQFGNVKRSMLDNNSIQAAQYEMCAHKWVDMSELTRGVALINDSKYGYACKNGCLSMNLLRSQKHPCVSQDVGEQKFSYALYMHDGNIHDSDVAAKAYAFNRPLTVVKSAPVSSLVSTDNPHAVIEAIKPAEDGNGYIVRLYNDRPDAITTKLTANGSRLVLTDMLEREKGQTDGTITMHGYEIVTVRVIA